MTTTTSVTDIEALVTTAKTDLASLRRVFHRLASIPANGDGGQFATVLAKLLPRLLARLGENAARRRTLAVDTTTASVTSAPLDVLYGQIHSQLTDMMSHVLQRVRLDRTCQLPCQALLALLVEERYTAPIETVVIAAQDTKGTATDGTAAGDDTKETTTWHVQPNVDSLTTTFCLTFLTVGLSRVATKHELAALLPPLLVLRGATYGLQTPQSAAHGQARQILHLLLRALVALDDESKNVAPEHQSAWQTSVASARGLCAAQPRIASALYSGLLDVLLYRRSASGSSTTSSVPPPGLSPWGHELLTAGGSDVAPDWAAEMALTGKLVQTQLALLACVAPARPLRLLPFEGSAAPLALLIVATGHAHGDVASQAQTWLKMHMDAARGTDHNKNNSHLGNPLALALELLQLAVGQAQADAASPLATAFSLETVTVAPAAQSTWTRQEILSTKRRPLEALVAAAALAFLAKLWQDFPSSLEGASVDDRQLVTILTGRLARHYLLDSAVSTSSGAFGKTRVASAQLMEALAVRWTSLLSRSSTEPPQVASLLTEILQTACAVLEKVVTSASLGRSSSTTTQALEGSLAIRDSCYLVLSHLARSPLFSTAMIADMGTAKLLFGCAAKEEDRLQPRAVAALDALLGAYQRLHKVPEPTIIPLVSLEAEQQANPWATPSLEAATSSISLGPDGQALSRSLLPLLWTASQTHQPRASRVAAARWTEGLLKLLDLVKACHLLCFLAGDSDVTAAAIARDGLGLSVDITDDSFATASESTAVPDFADFVHLVFESSQTSASDARVQLYQEFSPLGKSAALRFGMVSLMADLYGGEDAAVALYLQNVADTLRGFQQSALLAHGGALMDLLDVTSACFTSTLASSAHARKLVVQGSLHFGVSDVVGLVFLATSSRARRYLAGAIGEVLKDISVWGTFATLQEWLESTMIETYLDTCCSTIGQVEKDHFLLGPVHGSLYLGAHLVRIVRIQVVRLLPSTEHSTTWEKVCKIVLMLAKGTLRSDDVVGNAAADGLTIALAYAGRDAPVLHPKLSGVLTTSLLNVASAMKKYKEGDATDAPRVTKLVEAGKFLHAMVRHSHNTFAHRCTIAGVCLAATTSHDGSEGNQLGSARMTCLESMTSLLGSGANRKDEEIALHVGEALGKYSDCYNVDIKVHDWQDGYEEELATGLEPHEHALYLLLRKQYRLSNPLHRTACAPALLGIVGLISRGVSQLYL